MSATGHQPLQSGTCRRTDRRCLQRREVAISGILPLSTWKQDFEVPGTPARRVLVDHLVIKQCIYLHANHGGAHTRMPPSILVLHSTETAQAAGRSQGHFELEIIAGTVHPAAQFVVDRDARFSVLPIRPMQFAHRRKKMFARLFNDNSEASKWWRCGAGVYAPTTFIFSGRAPGSLLARFTTKLPDENVQYSSHVQTQQSNGSGQLQHGGILIGQESNLRSIAMPQLRCLPRPTTAESCGRVYTWAPQRTIFDAMLLSLE